MTIGSPDSITSGPESYPNSAALVLSSTMVDVESSLERRQVALGQHDKKLMISKARRRQKVRVLSLTGLSSR